MRSLWKDLLFLHGHMAHANLIWSELDTSPDHDTASAQKPSPSAQACTAACGIVAALPRIAAPR